MTLLNQSARLLSSHFRQEISIEREKETLNLTAVIYPTGSNDILLLPESERYLPSVKVFTLEPLKRGDLISHNGYVYTVKSVAQWGDYGYYNSIAIRHIPTAKGGSGGFIVT